MSLQFGVFVGPDMGRTFTVQAGNNLLMGRGERS